MISNSFLTSACLHCFAGYGCFGHSFLCVVDDGRLMYRGGGVWLACVRWRRVLLVTMIILTLTGTGRALLIPR